MARQRKRVQKHITVISRRRPWDDEAFARAIALFVTLKLQQAAAEDGESEEPTA